MGTMAELLKMTILEGKNEPRSNAAKAMPAVPITYNCCLNNEMAQLYRATMGLCREAKPTKIPGPPVFGLTFPGFFRNKWKTSNHTFLDLPEVLATKTTPNHICNICHRDWNYGSMQLHNWPHDNTNVFQYCHHIGA